MTVQTISREEVVTTTADVPIPDAAEMLRDENVGCLVVTENDRPVGVLTDRDVAVRVVAEGTAASELTAGDVMTEDPATFPVDGGVFELTDAMSEGDVRRMPVVDSDGALAGIVTMDDLHRLLVEELDNLNAVVAAESPPY